MNFHLKIECPSWFKIGDWDKVEKTLLRLGEFGNEPDACGASIGEMTPDNVIRQMIDEALERNKSLFENVKELVIKGNGECPECGYPNPAVDGTYYACNNCNCVWSLSQYDLTEYGNE